MATQPNSDTSTHGTPSRPSKLTYVVGAVLLVLFIVYVLSQSPTVPGGQ